MKEKDYEKITPEENRDFQGSSLELVTSHMKVEAEEQAEQPAVDPLIDAPMFEQNNQSDLFCHEEEEEDNTENAGMFESAMETEPETSVEQSMMAAVADQFEKAQQQIIKTEDQNEVNELPMDAQVNDEVNGHVTGQVDANVEVSQNQPEDEVEYACDMCCVQFDSEEIFQAHTSKIYHQSGYKKWSEEYPYQCEHCLKRCRDPRALQIHAPLCKNIRVFRRIVNGRIATRDLNMDTSNVIKLTRSMVNKWKSEHPDDGEDLSELIDEEDEGPVKEEVDVDFDPDDEENDLDDVKKKKRLFIEELRNEKMNCVHCEKLLSKSAFQSHCA